MAEINLDDLEPNSHKYKEEKMEIADEKPKRERLKPVIKKDNVVSTKKTLSEKFVDTFIQEDVNTVKKYVIDDVVIPGFKNLVLDCLSMFFFKEAYDGRRRGRDDDDYYDYSVRYKSGKKKKKKKKRDDDEYDDDEEKTTDYRHIVLKHREDAEEVCKEIRRRIKKYDKASVADLFDLIGKTGKYTDNNWGWTDKDDIGIRRVSNGFLIDVTEAELLEE